MSLKEKDLEAERKEHISFDEKSYGGRDDRVNLEDTVDPANDSSGPASSPIERDDKETRRIIRKIDLRLLPTLAVIYAFALIDRVNLPNARIAGMDEDLGLSIGSRYSILTMIFFYSVYYFPVPCQHHYPKTRPCGLAALPGRLLGRCHDRHGLHG